jgi:hypothetical protein
MMLFELTKIAEGLLPIVLLLAKVIAFGFHDGNGQNFG